MSGSPSTSPPHAIYCRLMQFCVQRIGGTLFRGPATVTARLPEDIPTSLARSGSGWPSRLLPCAPRGPACVGLRWDRGAAVDTLVELLVGLRRRIRWELVGDRGTGPGPALGDHVAELRLVALHVGENRPHADSPLPPAVSHRRRPSVATRPLAVGRLLPDPGTLLLPDQGKRDERREEPDER